MAIILQVKDISKNFLADRGFFSRAAGRVKALSNISFSVEQFATLGLVGESGSGKTTLAKIIMKLVPPDSGEAIFNPELVTNFRKDTQIIFQNPFNSLDPKMSIFETICEPLSIHRILDQRFYKDEVIRLLGLVGLDEKALQRKPIAFSGGQRQRICIARALAARPKFLVLDEPISSLDLTIQAQMLDLFIRLKEELKLTYLFISHNLAVVKYLADSVIVLKEGLIVESSSSKEIFTHPRDPYTRALLDAARG